MDIKKFDIKIFDVLCVLCAGILNRIYYELQHRNRGYVTARYRIIGFAVVDTMAFCYNHLVEGSAAYIVYLYD